MRPFLHATLPPAEGPRPSYTQVYICMHLQEGRGTLPWAAARAPAAAPAAAADYLAPRPPRPPRPPLPRPAGGKKPRMLFWPAAAAVPAFLAPPRPPPRPRPAKNVDTRGAGAVPDCRI